MLRVRATLHFSGNFWKNEVEWTVEVEIREEEIPGRIMYGGILTSSVFLTKVNISGGIAPNGRTCRNCIGLLQ